MPNHNLYAENRGEKQEDGLHMTKLVLLSLVEVLNLIQHKVSKVMIKNSQMLKLFDLKGQDLFELAN